MSAYLLKKLTRKSVIDGGKNKGLIVQEVMNKCKIDLIYSYFHYNRLTFMDDILDELRINPEDRIEKPGKDPEKFQKYVDRNISILAYNKAKDSAKEGDEVHAYKKVKNNIVKSRFKAKYKALIERERILFSKGALQRKNHGKK